MYRLSTRCALTALALIMSPTAMAADDGSEGKGLFDLRYRYEGVEQSNFAEDATANTLRVRAGYQTATTGLYFLGEIEAIVNLSGDYNSTDNGLTTFPTIADPQGAEINQAFVGYRSDGVDVRVGLHRIGLGNLRFIANVGFRQREQTYLGGSASIVRDNWSMNFGQLLKAQRIFGADHSVPAFSHTDLNAQFVDFTYGLGPVDLTLYYHAIGNSDVPAASHMNVGLAAVGRHGSDDSYFSWRLEYAEQDDIRGGVPSVGADYSHIFAAYNFGNFDIGVGSEILGGDGVYGFQTPLATLHKFNGWADQFLTTPVTGLVDNYASVGARFGRFGLRAMFHDFESDFGSADLGDEMDFQLSYNIGGGSSVAVKYADYSGAGGLPDVTKTWVTFNFKY